MTTMNYAIKLVIYFMLCVFVVLTTKILPKGILTENYLNEIHYFDFIRERDHGGSGFLDIPNATLWLGILYYFIILLIHILQFKHKENSILDLFFIIFKKRVV